MLSIVVVNWNAGSQLAETIASVGRHHHDLIKSVIIVDNASTDDSLAGIELLKELPFELQIVKNTCNRGFAAACNQGAAATRSEYLLFLNPDTVIFDHSFPAPLAFMQSPRNEDVGIIGIQLVDDGRRIARSCSRFPTLGLFLAHALGLNRLNVFRHFTQNMTEWSHERSREVDQIMGAFFLIRRSLFEFLGGFDERFFMYFEEVDLSLRAHKTGWRSVYLKEAQALHIGGATTYRVKAHRLFYLLRSRLLYAFKHFTPWKVWALMLVTLILEPVSRSVYSLHRGGVNELFNTLRGYSMLYHDLPSIITKARQT